MTLKLKADTIGIVSSTICLLHCIATPFLFIVKSCTVSCCSETPIWWRLIDYVFLIVSFIAIHQAINKNTKSWMVFSFWAAWITLFLAILNESFEIVSVSEAIVYIPALIIISLHFYNHKYCKCINDSCAN